VRKEERRTNVSRRETAGHVKTTEDAVEQYLRALSPVRAAKSNAAFRDQLAWKHGKDRAFTLWTMLDRRAAGNLSDDLYGFKNQSLQFSIDVTFAYSRELYKRLMTWLLDRLVNGDLPGPSRILDLGCEQGLNSCLLASFFPESQVMGIDVCEPAIERARELAGQLQLKNVAFGHHDLAAGLPADWEGRYSLVLDSRVLSGSGLLALPDDDAGVWSLSELDPVVSSRAAPAILRDIARSLDRSEGAFVRADWLGNYESLLQLTRQLEATGLALDWPTSCCLLSVPDFDAEKELPILVARNWAVQVISPLHEVLALVAHPDLVRLSRQVTFTGAAAETIFDAFSDKKFVAGSELEYSDGSGRSRRELWQAGGLVLSYHRTTRWFRQLSLHPSGQLPQLLEELAKADEEGRRSGAGLVVPMS
jgi:SAM-dependent methyltransferase